MMSAALVDEVLRPLKKLEPPFSRYDDGWVRGWSLFSL
jgi:hypothetical protein